MAWRAATAGGLREWVVEARTEQGPCGRGLPWEGSWEGSLGKDRRMTSHISQHPTIAVRPFVLRRYNHRNAEASKNKSLLTGYS